MKKVLIITYYWIPSGGAGVQRWVKFAKYLRDFGWEPVIYTPENPEYPSIDHSFEQDIPVDIQVLKTPIWEPYDIYRQLTGKKGQRINAGFISENKKSSWKDKLLIWVRGNFLIPDPRRFWIRPSVQFLEKYLVENGIDTIITTGPPHSMHRIGLGLKLKLKHLKWVADFRDPWTNIDFYKELNLTPMADAIHHRMEREVVQYADAVVVVSNGMAEEFSEMKPKELKVITNGYDESDVKKVAEAMDEKFSISHIGTLNAARNPHSVWEALSEICSENKAFEADLEIQLIGKVDFSVIEEIQTLGLEVSLNKIDYLPHADAIARQQNSQLLLLLINNTANAKGILTGKFFEYLASGRPIFGVGPVDGDAAEVLARTGAGVMVGFEDVTRAKQEILKFYELYKNGTLLVKASSVDQYSRRSLTKELAHLLNGLQSYSTI